MRGMKIPTYDMSYQRHGCPPDRTLAIASLRGGTYVYVHS